MSRRIMMGLGLTAIVVIIGAVTAALTTVGAGESPSGVAPVTEDSVQTVEGGGITVQAVLRSVSGQALEFEITMDTHSVDLQQFDLGEMSRAVLSGGRTLTDAVWTPKGDSHHIGGVLEIHDPEGWAGGTGTIALEITGLPGGDVRRFEWQGAPQ